MTQAQAFEGMSPGEIAEKIYREGGQEGLAYASMVIAIKAIHCTKEKDDGLGSDIAKNLFSFMKAAAIESFLGGLCKKAIEDKEFKEAIEEAPMLAMAVMGKQTCEEKRKYMDILNNLCHAALDLGKEAS